MHRKPPAQPRHTPPHAKALERRMARRPQWFSTFLAGNHREKTRLRREMATLKGSVVWLLRQRRQGQWSVDERTRLREVMRSASEVSPYLIIWVVPGSLLLLPFLAWFMDNRRQRRAPGSPESTAASTLLLPHTASSAAPSASDDALKPHD